MAPGGKRLDVEVLRGVCVLLVLLYHLRALPFGFLGVDAFFVVSGYLMGLLYLDTGWREFFKRRLSRLLPAYFVVLIAVTLASAMVALPHEFDDVGRHAMWSAALMPNIGFWDDASYFDSAYFRPFLNFWSLGVELQFYLVFPLIAWAYKRWPKVVMALSVASFLGWLAVHQVSPKTAFFWTPLRVWQFMLGFYVVRLSIRGEFPLAGLLALVLAGPWLPISVLSAGAAVLTALFIAGDMPIRRWMKPLVGLGELSYSVYLVHFPVIVLLAYEPFGGTRLELSPGQIGLALALTFSLSWLLWRFVEKPLRERRSGWFVIGTAIAGAAAGAGAAVASVPVNRSLIHDRELQVVDAWLDRLDYRCGKPFRVLNPFDESCPIGGNGGRGFLLVGDSHADVLKEVLAQEVARAGGNLRLMVGNGALGHGYTAEEVAAEADKQGSSVIVVHASAPHMNPAEIKRLERMGRRVVVIAPVPEPGYHVPRRIYALLQAGQEPRPTESLEQHRVEVAGVMRGLEGSTVFDPAPLLCNPMCQIEEGGRPLYSDVGHLSQTGVRKLRPMLAEVAGLSAEP